MIIDDEDIVKLKGLPKPYLSNRGYAESKKTISIHRLIMNCPDDLQVDHINGNPLDNRKCNLRIVTVQQNTWNQLKSKRPLTSKYLGVCKTPRNTWRATIRKDSKTVSIGDFDTELHAAMARDIWAKDLRGEYAKLNFIY